MKIQSHMHIALMALLYWSTLWTAGIATSCKSQQMTGTGHTTFEPFDYTTAWHKIDSLERNQLYRSALDGVEEVSIAALRESNGPQQIRAAIYRNKYAVYLNDDGMEAAISGMEASLAAESGPEKSILYSLTAELYHYYVQARSWMLNDRTTLPGVTGDDIRTWDIADFVNKINSYYFASIADPNLQTIPIGHYEAILTGDTSTDILRPTLYDLLAHRAVDHFAQSHAFMTDPVDAFAMTDIALLSPAADFANYHITTPDTGSYKRKALEIFQSLITQHLPATDPAALIDVDLKRLSFVYQNVEHEGKDAAYLKALESLTDQYPESPAAASVMYEIGSFYNTRAQQYSGAPDDPFRYDLRTASEICASVIEKYPGTRGASQCANLLQQLLRPHLSIQVEKVIPGTEHILTYIGFRNMENIRLRVVALTYDDLDRFTGRPAEDMAFLNAKGIIQQVDVILPVSDDLREHSTEAAIDPLPYGFYALIATHDTNGEDDIYAYGTFHVSDLAFWHDREPGRGELVVVDRHSGAPQQGVKVEFFSREYDSRMRRSVRRPAGTFTTGTEGTVSVPSGDHRHNLITKLTKGPDVLFTDDAIYTFSYFSDRKPYRSAFLFTDRAIYRPGQTIHFKGYLIDFDRDRMPAVAKKGKVTVKFLDVNNQLINSLEFTPNAYGTFSGSFTAPEGRLAGSMRIVCEGDATGSTTVRVEEYKRPTFEITWEPPAQAYRLGEEVNVEGLAQRYAGVPVDGATVSYRIVRRVHFPWRSYWSRIWIPNVPEMVIAHGTTDTDVDGTFNIQFHARDDASLAGNRPEYVFVVEADVTDQGGETRSAQRDVVLARHSFRATVGIGEYSSPDALRSVIIRAMNLNGEDVAITGEVTIERLAEPVRVYRKRYWGDPDMPLIDDEVYGEQFPSYARPGRSEISDWEVVELRGSRTFVVNGTDTLSLASVITNSGPYRLTFVMHSAAGDSATMVLHTHYIDTEADLPPYLLLSQNLLPGTRQPGNDVSHVFKSSGPVHVRYVTDRRSGVRRHWIDVHGDAGRQTALLENDRGGVHLSGTYVYDSRVFQWQHHVPVPWSNKDLLIEYLSYRDKTEPGAEEEWRLKISGEQKDAVVAELLATMYDASLDAFVQHNWAWSLYPQHNRSTSVTVAVFGSAQLRWLRGWQRSDHAVSILNYRTINWYNFPFYHHRWIARSGAMHQEVLAPAAIDPMLKLEAAGESVADASFDGESTEDGAQDHTEEMDTPIQVRTNLDETVFFMPHILTDAEGNITLRFKMNEALTRWKFLALAHTYDLHFGLSSQEIVTQKEIMVFPQMPRFLRQKDDIWLSARVHNMSSDDRAGEVTLAIYDADTGEQVDEAFGLRDARQSWAIAAGTSAAYRWKVSVPSGWTSPLKYQVIARTGNTGDGEEGILPVLTDRIFVTETMAMHIPAGADRTFVFDALKNSTSSTLDHQRYTVEFTSNPAWYAVQALPYLQEFPHQCSEQVWNRLYANLVARRIVEQFPEIASTYSRWTADPDGTSLQSALTKNQDLKSAMLEETPWVRDAQAEEEQMRNIAALLDGNRIMSESMKAIATLKQMQLSNGGFPWFSGGRDNRYITQYIVEGAGHLHKLQAIDAIYFYYADLMQIIRPAIKYIDARLVEQYEELAKSVAEGKTTWEEDHLNHIAAHYLYARSFFIKEEMSDAVKKARDYYLSQAVEYWNTRPLYVQALLALSMHRWDSHLAVVGTMKQSFEERSLINEELGRYWKTEAGFYWYELPIERHSLMIELFEELGAPQVWIDELRLWLLKTKQTNRWSSTKSTAAAVYALLMHSDNWLTGEMISVVISGDLLTPDDPEAGSGYFRHSWPAESVDSDKGTITVNNPNKHVAWGGAYWQYFEDMDKVVAAEGTPLKLRKGLYRQVSTDEGLKLVPVTDGIAIGDKLISRIEIEVDRDMEFVHLKDMRASGLEPVNVLSQYKWQGGLGYYESTADLATHFFFDRLPRGRYIFEYPLRVAHSGTFSNGIATLQCMYAPEFSSHSGGLRIQVKE